MKQSLTLMQLAEQIQSRAAKKRDLIAYTDQMSVSPDNTMLVGNYLMKPNAHCHGQIAEHLKIPTRYYKRMLKEQPDLWAANVNTWLTAAPEKRMLRTYVGYDTSPGVGRAFLSDRFAMLDDDAFANTVLPVMAECIGGSSYSFSSDITETRTYIKFTSDRFMRDVKVGDTVRFGICFWNSEVGDGRLAAALFAEQLRCTNGMVMKEEMWATNHIGKKIGNINLDEVLQIDTIRADNAATMMRLRDYAGALLSDQRLDEQVEKMRGLTAIEISDPVKAVQVVAQKNALSESTQTNVLAHLIKGGDLSMWGLQNAVTRAAADEQSYDEATRLESIGGNMLTLSRSEYTELKAAA